MRVAIKGTAGASFPLLFALSLTIVNLSSCEPLNPSEVVAQKIRDRYNPSREDSGGGGGGLLQEFDHVEIVHEVEKTKHDETHEKEEKDREKWKAKYLVVKKDGSRGGTNGRKRDEQQKRRGEKGKRRERKRGREDTRRAGTQDAGHVVAPTRRSGFDTMQGHNGHPPSSSSSGMIISLQYYFKFLNFYLPKSSVVNHDCARDLASLEYGIVHFEEMLANGTFWPLKMVDSWGKTADGILEGNFNLMGFFQECISTDVLREDFPKADFQGKYCTISYEHISSNMKETYPNGQAVRVPAVSSKIKTIPSMFYSTCMPSTCTQEELRESIAETLNQSTFQVSTVQCQTQDDHYELTAGSIFGIVFFSIIGIVLLSASVIDTWADYYPESDVKNGPMRYLLVFSVPCNVQKLFHIDGGRNPNVISCLHGLRFLSICWVVLGHQYAYSVSLASNKAELPKLVNKVAFQMLANADVSVDTFFFMSGVLVCMSVLTLIKKTGKFNIFVYILHRILRLLPPIAITCAFLATLSSFFVSGPLAWYYEGYLMKGCRHSWWIDISFASNLIYPFLGNMNKANESASCLPHCWFTGVDMQLHLFAPIILLPLYFWEKKGVILLGFWTMVSVVIPSAIIGAYHLWPATMLIPDPTASLEYTHKVYLMPWCRAGPYIVGIAIGYVLYISRESPSITRLSRAQVAIGWLATTAVGLSVIFGIEKYNKFKLPDNAPEMSAAEAVLYGGFHRAVWGSVIGWIVLACHWGYGGPINWFLSHPAWQPLSRLTYCIYLTSLPIQFAILSSTVRPTYFSNLSKVQETCGALLITIAFSIVLTLIAESPIIRLEKLLLHPEATSRRSQTTPYPNRQTTVSFDDKSDGEDYPEHTENVPA